MQDPWRNGEESRLKVKNVTELKNPILFRGRRPSFIPPQLGCYNHDSKSYGTSFVR
jgi:hypothetical protein